MLVTVRVSPRLVVTTLVVVAVLAVTGTRILGGTHYRTDGPAPETITVAGVPHTLVQQQPVVAVTVAADDPSRLVVDVDAPAGCSLTTVRIAEQDGRVVRLAAYTYSADGAGDEGACTGQVAVDLGAPLDGRRVVEAGTDHVLVTGTAA